MFLNRVFKKHLCNYNDYLFLYSNLDLSYIRGPQKVVNNLIKGFKKVNFGKYILNNPINNYEYKAIGIISDINIFEKYIRNNKLFVGPNCGYPEQLEKIMKKISNINNVTLITPSEWVSSFYKKYYFPSIKIINWPVGIDIEIFKPVENIKFNDFLIYFKGEPYKPISRNYLNYLINILKKYKFKFTIVEYGKYNEDNFIKIINNSKYAIILTDVETQGIAIQEIMSCNLPCLVFDPGIYDRKYSLPMFDNSKIYSLDDFYPGPTSVPYWDEKCGIKFNNLEIFESSLSEFMDKINSFNPRSFIENNLSLEICSRKYLDIISN